MLSTSLQNNIILVTEYGYTVEGDTRTDSGRRWRWGGYDKNRYIAAWWMEKKGAGALHAEGVPGWRGASHSFRGATYATTLYFRELILLFSRSRRQTSAMYVSID